MTNTKTIARNTGWYGLENIINVVVQLFTSIAVARTLGPTKMGYIVYVVWIGYVATSLGGAGIAQTTRKYMAEFLGQGDRGTARYVYFRTLYLQMGLATFATAAICIWVLMDAAPEYRLASLLIVLSIWPSMVNFISAQANVAAEELSRNLPASIVSMIAYFAGITATIVFGLGVVGVGGSMLLMRLVDWLVRFLPTVRSILEWEKAHVEPPGLRKRMMSFAWQSVATMVVALIVWERSELFLMKRLCSDIRQLAFYSVAFNLAERLLLSASIFGTATGATIFAQYGRDKSKLPDITASSFRYIALTSIPLHCIATALAAPVLLVLYGNQYSGATAVATLAPLLCMPKAFMTPVQSLLQSMERQSYVIVATLLAGIADFSIAWWLIPAHGAVGACIGSGAAQVMAIGMMWAIAIRLFKVKLPWRQLAKVSLASLLAALAAHYVAIQFAPFWGIVCGGIVSLVVLLGLFYSLRVLEAKDGARFRILSGMLPKRMAGPADRVLSLLVRPELASAVPSGD